MIKYFVIICGIFVTFVTGQQQQGENFANYQGVLPYLPSGVEQQFPLEVRASKPAPKDGVETHKIPCPIFPQRRSKDPNIPSEEPWVAANKWNSVPFASRRFYTTDLESQRSNVEDPVIRRSDQEDPTSRRSNTQNPISRSFNLEDPNTWRFIAEVPISRRFNLEDSALRKSNFEHPESWQSNSDNPHVSLRSNSEDSNSWESIADDPISRRSNLEDSALRRSKDKHPESWQSNSDNPHVSLRSNSKDSNAWESIADDPISRRSNLEDSSLRKSNVVLPESWRYNTDDHVSRRSNLEVPASLRYNEKFPASRRYPWQSMDRLEQTPNNAENQPVYPSQSNNRQALPTSNFLQTQRRRDNFDGAPLLVQSPYDSWQVPSTNSPIQVSNSLNTQSSNNVLNVPSPNDDIQTQAQINYPVEITSPNPSNTKILSDCNSKPNLSSVIEPFSETRREESPSRRIIPGSLQPSQISNSPNLNVPENNQPGPTTLSNKLSTNGEVTDTNTEGNDVPQESSDEQKPEDRMSISEIEQQLMEPAKGAGIIKITDAHHSVMDSSRVCYACSSITDPTCWSPERKTTVKYCARGRDSCVTKTYTGMDSLVVIRDCSTACDDALPVLGKKYESCSICENDLCNNFYVDANAASSIYTRNVIGIMIFGWLIKHNFQ